MRPATEPMEPSWTNNYRQRADSYSPAPYRRQPFHRPRTSLGAAGHLLHLGMVAAPLLIGEVIKDPENKWRAMRMVPVLGAIASEALWTLKIGQDRKREEADHAALESCQNRCR
jgi:hypothetical protein